MSEEREHNTEGRRSWLDDPKNGRKIVLAVAVSRLDLCFHLLLVA